MSTPDMTSEANIDDNAFISAILAEKFSFTDPLKASEAVKASLQNYPGELRDDWIAYLARDMKEGELDVILHSHLECKGLRNASERLVTSLANFIEFQVVAFPSKFSPFVTHPETPPGIDALYRWGASQLHDYGRQQSVVLANVAFKLLRWCQVSGIKQLDIIESPIGATLPVRVLAETLRDAGIEVGVHVFLSPRLDRHGTKNSISSAAAMFCKPLRSGSHPVLFPDEVITGTRFLKLHKALKKHLGERIIPLALEVKDWSRTEPIDPSTKERLSTLVHEKRIRFPAAPTHIVFPPALLAFIDDGAPICASNPFFWSELDICAGKRKVNLLFGLLHELQKILDELSQTNSKQLNYLCNLWGRSAAGFQVIGHDLFIKEKIPSLAKTVNWDVIYDAARAAFKEEYEGRLPSLSEADVQARLEWVLCSIREQIDKGLVPEDHASEGWMLQKAALDLFALSSGNRRGPLPRDRDFSEYTLPYVSPVFAVHEELVRLVLNDVKGWCCASPTRAVLARTSL
jgi:hypothetical protein